MRMTPDLILRCLSRGLFANSCCLELQVCTLHASASSLLLQDGLHLLKRVAIHVLQDLDSMIQLLLLPQQVRS